MLKSICMLAVVWMLAGCAALVPLAAPLLPSGSANGEFHSATKVKLEQANFMVVKTNVMGESKGFSLLGIITMVPARYSTAMDRLYVQAEMRPGQAQTLANIMVERSTSYLVLYSIPRVSIRADVMEFLPVLPARPPPAPSAVTSPAPSAP